MQYIITIKNYRFLFLYTWNILCWKQPCCLFIYFLIFWWIKSLKELHLFKIEIFSNHISLYYYFLSISIYVGSHITQQPKTGCPLKLSRVELVSTWKGDLLGKTRLLLEEVLVRLAGGAHPVVCVGPNAPV